eukprot:m.110156 g.110156  ORF g.110156 m.110156 type:complete len:135 (+) comp15263_c0_seq1:122-526(+)
MNMDHILWLQIKLIRRSFGFPVSCFLKNLGDVAYSFEGSSMHNNTAAFLNYFSMMLKSQRDFGQLFFSRNTFKGDYCRALSNILYKYRARKSNTKQFTIFYNQKLRFKLLTRFRYRLDCAQHMSSANFRTVNGN